MRIPRRRFLALGGLALAGVACGGSGTKTADGPGAGSGSRSLDDLIAGRPQGLSVIHTGTEVLPRRDERFTFALADPSDPSRRIIADEAQVWVAPSRTDPALGPFVAPYRNEGLGERFGIYSTRIEFPAANLWLVLVEATPPGSGEPLIGGAQVAIGPRNNMPKPGDAAVAVATPTTGDPRGVDPICTRQPPCDMHYVSLDEAMASGKPSVLIIATPAFCQSQLCGPEVEIIQTVESEIGRERANWIHVEVYKDDEEAPARQLLSPAAEAWTLEEEPVTYLIRADGTIADRILGPFDLSEARETLGAFVA